jgi:xanthine permease XanP
LPLISLPTPFKFGFNFDWTAFLPVALIYLISTIETVGDLTANCMIARQPISGPSYISRLRGGVLGDGVSCMIAATFSAFPNTTFAQNNGVIQLTGVASRYVGLYIGAMLFCLGLFPMIGAVLQQIPNRCWRRHPGDVRQRGRGRVRILAQAPLDRRSMLIIATSLGVGLGIAAQPTCCTCCRNWCRTCSTRQLPAVA